MKWLPDLCESGCGSWIVRVFANPATTMQQDHVRPDRSTQTTDRSIFVRPVVLGLLFAIAAGVLLLFNLGGYRSFAWHEVRAVVPARQMLATGDYVVPDYGGEPRLSKPPLVYWMLASIGSVCGEINEFNARMPQAIAAVLLCLVMSAWAGRWYGREAGWIALFVQLTSAWLLIWGRKCEIDMTIWLCSTTGLYLVGTQPEHESRRRAFLRWTGVFGLVAIAWMGKFHYAAAMVFVPAGVFLLLQRRYRDLWNFANPAGWLLLAAAMVLWPLLVLQQSPDAWQIWYRETIGRATGALGHKPIWYYLPRIVSFSLPWTPFAILAVRSSWRRAWHEGDFRDRFLWVWLLTHLAIVSLQPNKHSHYVLSALPMLTLLSTQSLRRIFSRVRNGEIRIPKRVAVALSFVIGTACASGAIIGQNKYPQLAMPMYGLATVVIVGTPIVFAFVVVNRHVTARLTLLGVFLAGWCILVGWITPARDHRREVIGFANQVRDKTPESSIICIYRMGEDPVVVAYVEGPVRCVRESARLRSMLSPETGQFVLTVPSRMPDLRQLGDCRIVDRMPRGPLVRRKRREPLILVEVRRQPGVASGGRNSDEAFEWH